MTPEPPEEFRTLQELEGAAARRLSEEVWAYVQGGAGEERTVRANLEAFARATVRPRVLRGVAELDLRCRILGRPVAAPFFVAPMAYQGKVHPDGEVGVARAAAAAGLLGVYSTLSTRSMEEIAEASGAAPRWFQLYHQPDVEVERRLLERAERAGYTALVLTVDTPVLGVRDRQARGGFAIDASVPVGNGPDVLPPSRAPTPEGETYALRSDAAATWELLDELHRVSRLPLVVKGILTADDAHRCVDHGASAVVVSNHGGRQLDGVPAALDALAEVVAAVGPGVEVYLDGGVRRGVDILVALARGAKAVGIGRPVLWALAVGGASGVGRYFSLLKAELATAMVLTGRRTIAEVDRTLTVGWGSEERRRPGGA
jgi:isopentenyl diphosphate isomerase/L-lactate dehydrogenase-like FMN-dependent dehydrogenase